MHCPLTTPGSRFTVPSAVSHHGRYIRDDTHGDGRRGPGRPGGRRQAALIPRRHARTHAPRPACCCPFPALLCAALARLFSCFNHRHRPERGRWSMHVLLRVAPAPICSCAMPPLPSALPPSSCSCMLSLTGRRDADTACAGVHGPAVRCTLMEMDCRAACNQLRVNVRWAYPLGTDRIFGSPSSHLQVPPILSVGVRDARD
jgi:hypothetical protein